MRSQIYFAFKIFLLFNFCLSFRFTSSYVSITLPNRINITIRIHTATPICTPLPTIKQTCTKVNICWHTTAYIHSVLPYHIHIFTQIEVHTLMHIGINTCIGTQPPPHTDAQTHTPIHILITMLKLFKEFPTSVLHFAHSSLLETINAAFFKDAVRHSFSPRTAHCFVLHLLSLFWQRAIVRNVDFSFSLSLSLFLSLPPLSPSELLSYTDRLFPE